MSLMSRIKGWFGKTEQKTLRYNQRHDEFDKSTNVGTDHKAHMDDRMRGDS